AGVTLARGPLGTGGPLEELAARDDGAASPAIALPVVVHYAQTGADAFARAESLAAALAEAGYDGSAIEPGSPAAAAPSVRYFAAADQQRSAALAPRLQAALKRPVTATLVPADPSSPPPPSRSIEIWLSPDEAHTGAAELPRADPRG